MLFNTKSRKSDLKKQAAIYFSDKFKHIIVAAQSQNDAGIIYDQEKCISLILPIDATALGTHALESFGSVLV